MVHERARLEAEAFLASDACRRLCADPDVWIRLLTPSGRFLHTDARLAEHLGYTPAAFAAANPYDLTHPDDAVPMAEAHKALANGPLQATYRFRRSDGTYAWLSTRFMLHGDLIVALGRPEDKANVASWAPVEPFI